MTYSADDFVDEIMDALGVPVTEELRGDMERLASIARPRIVALRCVALAANAFNHDTSRTFCELLGAMSTALQLYVVFVQAEPGMTSRHAAEEAAFAPLRDPSVMP